MIRSREISSVELVAAHLRQNERLHPALNAVVTLLGETALQAAAEADKLLASDGPRGPLHGVPFSVKDSLDLHGHRTTAGTIGRRDAAKAERDATLVARLRAAGGIPIAKTNLPDLLFSFETDNLIFGRTNNPYDPDRSPGGSSGGESALLAACGSPVGLGSDALGSVRVPAAFCGIASIKPTSGRLPRTGHVPPPGLWIEALWQIGPMARYIEDLELVLPLLAHPDDEDFTSPPVPVSAAGDLQGLRVACFASNKFAPAKAVVAAAVKQAAGFLERAGMIVEEQIPPGIEDAYELELALLGADGGDGIEAYLHQEGSRELHPYLTNFLDRFRPFRTDGIGLSRRWAQWDRYRADVRQFFTKYDAIICPVYSQTALEHGGSQVSENFHGFSYTMPWNLAGAPAATVRIGEDNGLPVNVQVITRPWNDMTALAVCRVLEQASGGWQPPRLSYAAGTNSTSTGDLTASL